MGYGMILVNSSPGDALGIFQPFLPIFPPVGLGYLAVAAEREGIPVTVLDEQVEKNLLGRIEQEARAHGEPLLFGFSVLTAALHQALKVAQRVKERFPRSLICFGGAHPTAMPEEMLRRPQVDFVIRGEGEAAVVELWRRLSQGQALDQVPNLSYRADGGVRHNPLCSALLDLDSLPSFPYHRFRGPQRYDFGFIVSSRGCPYKCIFCSNRNTMGRKYRFRSPELVADELEMLHRDFAVRNVLFLDDNLLVHRPRAYRLMEEIRRRRLHERLTFSFQARGDNVDPELLHDLYACGFRSVFFGLETASDRLMEMLDKGETVEQCKEAVRMAKREGFHVSGTFMYALPGETHRDRMDCLRLSRQLDLDLVRFNNATPYPGTRLHELAIEQGRLHVQGEYRNFNSVSTFIENPFRKIPFSYVPPGNTEPAIRHDILVSYLAFYLSWRRLKGIFFSPDRGVGWFNAGRALLDFLRSLPALAWMGLALTIKFVDLLARIAFRRGDDELTLRECARLMLGPGRDSASRSAQDAAAEATEQHGP